MILVELLESLNSRVDFRVSKQTRSRFETRATIGGRDVIFNASFDDEMNLWHVDFSELTTTSKTFGATSSGAALQVGAFVRDSLIEFTQLYAPTEFEFTAENETRAKIYQRVISKALPQYRGSSHAVGSEIQFNYMTE